MATVSAGLFKSSLGRKYLMAFSGLFLCLFLVVHVAGNLQLFKDDGGRAFNEYTYLMTHNPFIKVVSYVNYLLILLHIVDGFMLAAANRKARSSRYAMVDQSKSSSWSSRNMAVLGTLILIFLVIHLRSFWFEMKFGSMPVIQYETGGEEYKDMYIIVKEAFGQLWYSAIYIVCMVALGFHLVHGFQSAFQTLGLNHHKYTPIIKNVGIGVFAILIPALFAAMPLFFLLLK
ncbi:MAG: succinate dehydrogenase cytochrome b subunit [Bacteroidia bacterium]